MLGRDPVLESVMLREKHIGEKDTVLLRDRTISGKETGDH